MKSKYCIIRYCEKVELGASLSSDLQIEAILEDFQKAKKLFENEEFKASKTEDEIIEFRLEEMFGDSSYVILAENKIDDRHVVRRFEIVENSREMEGCPYEGCSLDQRDQEPNVLEVFETASEAIEALEKYEGIVEKFQGNVHSFFRVTEYYIEENVYDKDGEFEGSVGILRFAPRFKEEKEDV